MQKFIICEEYLKAEAAMIDSTSIDVRGEGDKVAYQS